MSDELNLMAGCGSFCGSCPNYLGEAEPRCAGCSATKGHPFWGKCALYSCIESKGVDHCGVCSDFPCHDLINHYNKNNPHGQRNAATRAGVLAYRSKHGDERALELLKKLGRPPSS